MTTQCLSCSHTVVCMHRQTLATLYENVISLVTATHEKDPNLPGLTMSLLCANYQKTAQINDYNYREPYTHIQRSDNYDNCM